MSYAKRLVDMAPFRVMKVLRRANELSAQGLDVVHMEVGEPDFPTPAPIIRAGARALSAGQLKYTDARGLGTLREAIARYYQTDYGLDIDERRIFVTVGGSGALLLTTALLMDPGDNLLMSDPGYPCNRHFMTAFASSSQLVPTTAENRFHLTPQQVTENWNPRTRGVLLASPANPTGNVMADSAMHQLMKVVSAHDGYLVSDEIYHGLVYEPRGGGVHSGDLKYSALHADPNAFVVNSFSKYFGMTGWRLGWLIAPLDAADDLEKLAQNLFICPPTLSQHAAVAAFSAPAREIMERQREEFRRRRDYLVPALRDIGFDIHDMPDGAFYVYAGIPEGYKDSEPFTEWLLEEHHVAVTPGTDFGRHLANRKVRFSYAQPLPRLSMAVDRLSQAMRGQ
ncbi:MAG: aminotransferase class I/II-fold pyridoxal phosphate-dependent enzyme [Proteobacteria bacterium]|nr:aminotransferase class I/II-fold pyridoxal phosphate-dependent enzyme [Pseudomonadota bacterium]